MTRELARGLRQSPVHPRSRLPSARLAALDAALLSVVLAGLAACAPAGGGAGPEGVRDTPAAAVADAGALSAEVRQGRASWADRVVQVRVVNGGTDPVTVRTATLTTASTQGPAVSDPERGRPVPAGRTRDFSVPLGPPVCGGDDVASAPVDASVVLELEVDGEPVTTGPIPVTDPQEHLPRILAEDCAAEVVGSALDVDVAGLGRLTTPEGLVGVLELSVSPVPGGPPATLTSVDGTILMAPVDPALLGTQAPEGTAPVVGDAWEPAVPVTGPTTVRLALRANRCDPHAVAEDKRGTFLGLRVTVDGVPQHVVHVGGGSLTGQVHDYVAAACGW